MRLANVPPPMALHEIEVSSTIIDVAITIRSNPVFMAVIGVLHNEGYSQFEWLLSSMVQKPPVCRSTNDFRTDTQADANRDRLYLQTAFSGSSSILFSKDLEKSTLTVIGEDGRHMEQISLHETGIEGMVRSPWISKSKTHVVLNHDGKLNSEELAKRSPNFKDIDLVGIELILVPFSTPRIDTAICDIEIEDAVNGVANGTNVPATKEIVFSLAENGSLFADERRLVRNCTSFLVTPAHLVFTTSQHLLKFVHLKGNTEGESHRAFSPMPFSYNTVHRTRNTS